MVERFGNSWVLLIYLGRLIHTIEYVIVADSF